MNFPTQAEVVVIGGGIAGCSIAYRLAELGWTDIVVVERNTLSSGTTWHAAGDIGIIRGSSELTQIMRDSVALYTSAAQETGQDIGIKHCGTMSLAQTEQRLIDYKRQVSLFKSIGGEAEVLPPDQISRLNPFMRSDDALGVLHCPEAYRVNPADVTQAVSKAARRRGVKIFENTLVTNIETKRVGKIREVSSLKTDRGSIVCSIIVLAGGAWSRDIGRIVGVPVPLHAVEHSYLITNVIEGVDDRLPISRDPDAYIYSREEVGGFLIGFFEPQAKPLSKTQLPDDFSFASLPEDWDHLEPHITNAIHRYPVLEHVGIKLLFTGPESFTPDGVFLMGPAPDIKGFHIFTGMNSSGIGQSGGAAKALAEWIDNGEPTIDVTPFDIRRFPTLFANTSWISERSKELPSWVFDINMPRREHKFGRNIRLSPFHNSLKKVGARFGQISGWERPNWYSTKKQEDEDILTWKRPAWFKAVENEHKAAREDVAIIERTPMAKILIEGPDSEALLQKLCANDIAGKEGRIIYTGMLNKNGGFEADLTVTRLSEDRFLIITGANEGTHDQDHIKRNADDLRVSITDITSGYAGLAVIGPKSRDMLMQITENDISNAAFPFLTAQNIWIGHSHAWALRVSYAGELGWELFIPTESAAAIYESIIEVGSDFNLRHAGAYASNTLRMEKGFRAWGHDISPVDTPFEAGLGFAVRCNKKAPFIGRDALIRQRDRGVQKQMVLFTMDETENWPVSHEPIHRDGEVVGHITSCGYGYTVKKMLAMGFVRNRGQVVTDEFLTSGQYEIEIAGQLFPATASTNAPYDPKGVRMRD